MAVVPWTYWCCLAIGGVLTVFFGLSYLVESLRIFGRQFSLAIVLSTVLFIEGLVGVVGHAIKGSKGKKEVKK